MTSFLLAYCLTNRPGARARSERAFADLTGQAPSATLETASFLVQLGLGASTPLASDHGGSLALALHGEIFEADDQALWLAERFAAQGVAAAERLNGSYALLLVDRARDEVAFVTDRMGSRRLYACAYGEGVLVASALTSLPLARLELDPVGVGWYLSATVHGGRTVLSGVRALERAAVHRFDGRGLQARPYWTMRYQPERLSASAFSDGLGERFVASMRRALYDQPKAVVSLSGGYDATGILGALRYDLAASEVETFTYLLGDPGPGSDAAVAREMAARTGYHHRLVQAYDGDLVRHIVDNAVFGQSQRETVDEVSALRALAGTLAPNAVLFVGDNVFGGGKCHALKTPHDALSSAMIHDPRELAWFAAALPDGLFETFVQGAKDDLAALLARLAYGDDLYDLRSLLYLERLSHHHMPWRENFASRVARVRNPLLDNALLEFMATVPSALRRSKVLWDQTLNARYPELYAVPRARSGAFRLDLAAEFRRHQTEVRALVAGHASKLDALIAPEAVLDLLEQVIDTRPASPAARLRARLHGLPQRLGRRLSRSRERAYRPLPPSAVEPARLLMRVLTLRTGLSPSVLASHAPRVVFQPSLGETRWLPEAAYARGGVRVYPVRG